MNEKKIRLYHPHGFQSHSHNLDRGVKNLPVSRFVPVTHHKVKRHAGKLAEIILP